MNDLLHNPLFIGGAIGTVTFVIGWALPNTLLAKWGSSVGKILKLKIGKNAAKVVADKLDAFANGMEEEANK